MKNVLEKLNKKENLSFEESKNVFLTIMEGNASDNEIKISAFSLYAIVGDSIKSFTLDSFMAASS